MHLEDSNWTTPAYGGTAIGTSTVDQNESFGYGIEYKARLNSIEEGWFLTSGSGVGGGGAAYVSDASGSGSYSAEFDGGAGTINGTTAVVLHDGWGYSYDQTYSYNPDDDVWTTTESGSGTTDGTSHSEYSGSGAYSSSVTSATGGSSASGGVEENGNVDSAYDAAFSWTDADWTMTRHQSESTLSHSHYEGGDQTQVLTSSGAFSSGDGSFSDDVSFNTHEQILHAEFSSSGNDTETTTGGAYTWSRSASGSNSGFTETTDGSGFTKNYGTATSTSTSSRVDTGYSSNASINYDRVDTTYDWSNAAADDGSAAESWSSGGTHVWSDTLDQNWTTAWTQTNTTGGSSSGSSSGSGSSGGSGSSSGSSSGSGSGSGSGGGGSGSGGGGGSGSGSGSGGPTTITTSGGTAGSFHTASSGSTSWANSFSSSTPATPGVPVTPPTNFMGRTNNGGEEGEEGEEGEGGGGGGEGGSNFGEEDNGGGGNGGGGGGRGWSTSEFISIITVSEDRPRGHGTQLFNALSNGACEKPGYSADSQPLDAILEEGLEIKAAGASVIADSGFLDFGQGITEEQLIAGAKIVATVGVSLIPGVGEGMDIYVLAHPDSTPLDRTFAVASLTVSALSFGFSPNFGGVRQALRGSAKTASETGQQVARHSGERQEVAVAACRSMGDGCFPAGTIVSAESGLRPIESIQLGERIWSLDMTTEQWELRPVLKCGSFEYEGRIVRLQIAGEIVESTEHHPFWVIDGRDLDSRPKPKHAAPREVESPLPGRWVDAVHLQECDILQLKSGIRVVITAIASRVTKESVYNFSVEEHHCYAVSKQAVLVHNTDCVYDDLVAKAQELYPNLSGKVQQHHITPKYLGGAESGKKVPLDAAYHQQITNAFRKAWPYGQEAPDSSQLKVIIKKVYSEFPLPPGTTP